MKNINYYIILIITAKSLKKYFFDDSSHIYECGGDKKSIKKIN